MITPSVRTRGGTRSVSFLPFSSHTEVDYTREMFCHTTPCDKHVAKYATRPLSVISDTLSVALLPLSRVILRGVRDTYTIQQSYFTLLEEIGMDIPIVLREAGLAPQIRELDQVRLPQRQYYALWNILEEKAEHPLWTLSLLDHFTSEVLAPPLFASLSSQNLTIAVRRIADYKALIAPLEYNCMKTDEGYCVRIEWDQSYEIPVSLLLFELLFIQKIGELGTRKKIVPLSITSTRAEQLNQLYASTLGISFSPDSTHSITFSEEDALRPFISANERIWRVFEPELNSELSRLNEKSPMSARVKGVLRQLLPSGQATIEAVARELNACVRTVQRRLQEEGTSFRTILHDTRVTLARVYARDTGYSRKEIAYLLGYSEAKSLSRFLRKPEEL